MNPSRSILGLVIAFPLLALGQAREPRHPIRVGANVQESKLVHRVEPVYPAEAKAARVSGIVILQVTVNEDGKVSDVKVLRGHPLLNSSVVEAVQQWRYSPTLLNGEPVPVIATVTISYGLKGITHGIPNYVLTLTEAGTLRDTKSGLEGNILLDKIRETGAPAVINPDPRTPFRVIEETMNALARDGLKIGITGDYVFQEGRLYYRVNYSALRVESDARLSVQPPVLALDNERIVAAVRSSAGSEEFPRRPDGSKVLMYFLFLNEVGEIVSVRQLGGPRLAEVEAELLRTRVVSPGRRGQDAVPVAVAVEVSVD